MAGAQRVPGMPGCGVDAVIPHLHEFGLLAGVAQSAPARRRARRWPGLFERTGDLLPSARARLPALVEQRHARGIAPARPPGR